MYLDHLASAVFMLTAPKARVALVLLGLLAQAAAAVALGAPASANERWQ